MAEPGAVGWQFSRKGLLQVAKDRDEDEVMLVALESGAEDVVDDGDTWRVICEPTAVFDVKSSLEAAGMTVQSATSTMLSSLTVQVTDPASVKAILRIMDDLDDNDDVQDVYANFDIADDLMAEVAS
jgi:transcriptional/translational regulatory protein YebC/TACO1